MEKFIDERWIVPFVIFLCYGLFWKIFYQRENNKRLRALSEAKGVILTGLPMKSLQVYIVLFIMMVVSIVDIYCTNNWGLVLYSFLILFFLGNDLCTNVFLEISEEWLKFPLSKNKNFKWSDVEALRYSQFRKMLKFEFLNQKIVYVPFDFKDAPELARLVLTYIPKETIEQGALNKIERKSKEQIQLKA